MFTFLRYYCIFIAITCFAQEDLAIKKNSNNQFLNSGQIALEQGFPSLAQDFFEMVITSVDKPSVEVFQQAAIGLLQSWVAQSAWEQAQTWLNKHTHQLDFSSPQVRLLQALLMWKAKQFSQSQSVLGAIDSSELPQTLRYEYFMLQGHLYAQQDDLLKAQAIFTQAKDISKTPFQNALAETQLALIAVYMGEVNETLKADIEKKLKKTRNRQEHAQLTWAYAQILVSLGHSHQAQSLIAAELRQLKRTDSIVIDSLLYLQAVICEPQSKDATQAWKALLERGTAQASWRLQALYTLEGYLSKELSWADFLEKCLLHNNNEPLVDALILAQAKSAYANHKKDQAIGYISKLFQRSPKSYLGPQAYLLEALIALTANPAQYRTAAAALANGQRDFGVDTKTPQWGLLEADCLYQAKDYEQAAHIYKSYLDKRYAEIDANEVLLKWVWACLELNNIDAIVAFLANPISAQAYRITTLSQVAWYLTKRQFVQGNVQAALASLEPWCTAAVLKELPTSWKANILWLGAILDFELGHTQFALSKATEALEQAQLVPSAALEDYLVAECLLLIAQTEFRLENAQAAQNMLAQLRADWPLTEPAQASYLLEARHYARTHQWALAQQKNLHLVELYPKSIYAPIALYEGALCAQRQASINSSEEAMKILDRLVKQFPDTEWVYEARFEQGQILRQLGRFGTAQVVYDGIIHDYAQSPNLWKARLARADCLLALAGNDPEKMALACAAYERVFDLTTIAHAARAEAGFKWAIALEQQHKQTAAKQAYWAMLNTLLVQPQAMNHSTPIEGGFWISRAIFALGQLLEQQGQSQEACKIYSWVEGYGLPGQDQAKAKMERIEKS